MCSNAATADPVTERMELNMRALSDPEGLRRRIRDYGTQFLTEAVVSSRHTLPMSPPCARVQRRRTAVRKYAHSLAIRSMTDRRRQDQARGQLFYVVGFLYFCKRIHFTELASKGFRTTSPR